MDHLVNQLKSLSFIENERQRRFTMKKIEKINTNESRVLQKRLDFFNMVNKLLTF